MTNYYQRLLDLFLFLVYLVHGKSIRDFIHECPLPEPRQVASRFAFTTVKVGGYTIKGDIKMIKIEFGESVDLVAVPLDKNGQPFPEGTPGYEVGSAGWLVQASDAEGNDVSDQLELTVDPDNELHATVRNTGTTELTGLVTLRGDGDPDADEEAAIVGTGDIIVDGPNAAAFGLTMTKVVTPPPPPVEEAPQ
jgi:hypothetical protein